jgi:3-dehydroquinate synthase
MSNKKNIISVNFDENQYEIYIKRGVINDLGRLLNEKTNNKSVIIIADNFFKDSIVETINTALTDLGYKVTLYLMDAGKQNKNFNEVLKIYSIMEEKNLARDSTLIAVGGGVIGDLAGFVASTWYRGMNLVHIPTTLMAMVDSSVGGKVAINFRETINAIGNYYHPLFILMDIDLVNSLSKRDYASGLAEVIKCALIADKDFYNYLENNVEVILNRKESDLIYLMSKTIKIKVNHVNGDVREGGKRLLLNYGHTLGHSIEISTEKDGQEQYRHGEGVAIGIMAASYIATEYLEVSTDVQNSIEALLTRYGLPTYVDSNLLGFEKDFLINKCIKNVVRDKKRINNKLRLILLSKIGKSDVYSESSFENIKQAFKKIIK